MLTQHLIVMLQELFDLILDMYFMAKTFWLTAVVFADLGSKYSLYFVLIFNDTLS